MTFYNLFCSNLYLSPSDLESANSPAQLENAESSAPQWEILPAELFCTYRLCSTTENRYLQPIDNQWFGAVGTNELALNDSNQQWYLIPVGNNYFVVFNANSFLLLQQSYHTRGSNPVTVGPLFSLFLGIWKIK